MKIKKTIESKKMLWYYKYSKKSKEKVKKEAQNMKNAETVARVHTHTRNLLKNKQAKKLALLMIYKADYFKKVVCFCNA